MKDLKNIFNFLLYLNGISPSERKLFFEHINDKQVNYISEMCNNFLLEKLPIDIHLLKDLKKVRKHIHLLASKQVSYNKKRIIIKSINGGKIIHTLLPSSLNVIKTIKSKQK